MHLCDLVHLKYSVLLHAVQFGPGREHEALQLCGSSSLAWSVTVCCQAEGSVQIGQPDPIDEQNVFLCFLRKKLRSGQGMSASKVWSDLSSHVSINPELSEFPLKTAYQG